MNKTLGIVLVLAAAGVALYLLFRPGGAFNQGGPLVEPGTTAATPGAVTSSNPFAALASAFSNVFSSFENPPASNASNPQANGILTGLIQGSQQAGSTYENPAVAVSDLQQGVVASTTPGFIQGASGEASSANPTYGTPGSADISTAPDLGAINSLTPTSDLLALGSPSVESDNTNETYDFELMS